MNQDYQDGFADGYAARYGSYATRLFQALLNVGIFLGIFACVLIPLLTIYKGSNK